MVSGDSPGSRWWLDRSRLELGISLEQVSPQLKLWSDASDGGWGAHLDESVTSGLWAPEEVEFSINVRELLAIKRALLWFAPQLVGSSVAIFADNSHGHCLPKEPRRYSLSSSELHRTEDSPLGGESFGCDFPTIHHGETQRASGFFVSPEPDSGLRMDPVAGGLSGSVLEVAGLNRPFCNITKSPMFDIFFSLPRSQRSGNGCASSELGWVAGVCLSSLVPNSSGSEEAPVVLWGPADHHSSFLASEAVVSRSSGSGGRWSGRSSSVQEPPASAPLPSVSSRGV